MTIDSIQTKEIHKLYHFLNTPLCLQTLQKHSSWSQLRILHYNLNSSWKGPRCWNFNPSNHHRLGCMLSPLLFTVRRQYQPWRELYWEITTSIPIISQTENNGVKGGIREDKADQKTSFRSLEFNVKDGHDSGPKKSFSWVFLTYRWSI